MCNNEPAFLYSCSNKTTYLTQSHYIQLFKDDKLDKQTGWPSYENGVKEIRIEVLQRDYFETLFDPWPLLRELWRILFEVTKLKKIYHYKILTAIALGIFSR